MPKIQCNYKGTALKHSSSTITPFQPRTSQHFPNILGQLLQQLNIEGLPTAKESILTTATRKEALTLLYGVVHPITLKLLYKIINIQFSEASRIRAGEYWDGEYYYFSQTYLDKKYNSKTRKIISEELTILAELGVIEYTKHYPGKCRGYKIIYPQWLTAFTQSITITSPKVWVTLSEERGIKPSEIAKITAKNVPIGMMNLPEVCNYFITKADANNNLDCLLTELCYALNNFVNRSNYNDTTGILTYPQTGYHTTAIGGRTHSNTGDQHISKELKAKWFNFKNVYNYDIRACHISLFNKIFYTNFANNWINHPNFKQELADKIGVSISILKQSILAITYGSLAKANGNSAIFNFFLNHFDSDELAKEKLELFNVEIIEYRTAISNWLAEIKANPKRYQQNCLKLKTDETEPKTLAAHWLHGLEQEAISSVSSLTNQKKYDYQVISNQFDGIVVIKEIPQPVLTNFTAKFNLILEVKAFI
jgi:hypothetical protein